MKNLCSLEMGKILLSNMKWFWDLSLSSVLLFPPLFLSHQVSLDNLANHKSALCGIISTLAGSFYIIFFTNPLLLLFFILKTLITLQYWLSSSILSCNMCFYVLWMCSPKVERFDEARSFSYVLVNVFLLHFISTLCLALFFFVQFI